MLPGPQEGGRSGASVSVLTPQDIGSGGCRKGCGRLPSSFPSRKAVGKRGFCPRGFVAGEKARAGAEHPPLSLLFCLNQKLAFSTHCRQTKLRLPTVCIDAVTYFLPICSHFQQLQILAPRPSPLWDTGTCWGDWGGRDSPSLCCPPPHHT